MTEPIRIVIADDHPIVRQGLATVLGQEEDLEIVGQAGNGLEAVDQARKLRPESLVGFLKGLLGLLALAYVPNH